MIKDPTRVTETIKTVLDLVIVNDASKVVTSGVQDICIADHKLVYVKYTLKRSKAKPKIITVKNYKLLDEEAFKNDIENAPWWYKIQATTILRDVILKQLRKISPHKASGPDSVTSRELKILQGSIVNSLDIIFKSSFQQSVFPRCWKIARIKSSFKKGKKKERTNYRPLSMLSIPSKLLESQICNTVDNHLDDNNIVTDMQWGFAKGRSTEGILLKLTESWKQSVDNGLIVGPMRPILYGDDHIKIVQESTCLGLRIDNRLDWKPQVQNVCRSFSKKLGALKRMRRLPSKVLEEIYYTTIIARTTYCISVWGNCSEATFIMLEDNHARAARLIHNLPRNLSNEESLARANWQPISEAAHINAPDILWIS
eukprot:gene3498-1881_t